MVEFSAEEWLERLHSPNHRGESAYRTVHSYMEELVSNDPTIQPDALQYELEALIQEARALLFGLGPRKYRLHIGWGSDPDREQESVEYAFLTSEERAAFSLGVSEADGWLESTDLSGPSVFRDGQWVPRPEDAC